MANCISFILLLTWCHLRTSRRNLCDVILDVCLQTRDYIMLFREIPPFPTRLWESPSHVGHALVSSRNFLLHSDSRGSFRISSWFTSSPLRFTWYLVDAVSSFSPSPVIVCYVLPKKFGPPFLPLHRDHMGITWRQYGDNVGTTGMWRQHGDNMRTMWRQHGDHRDVETMWTMWRQRGDHGDVETTWGQHGDNIGTTWRQHWDNIGTTGMWRPHGDNVRTTGMYRPSGDNMETTWGQHEDNVETTWGQCEDHRDVETTWGQHGDMGIMWGPWGCGDHMGTTWRQHGDNMRTMWRQHGVRSYN